MIDFKPVKISLGESTKKAVTIENRYKAIKILYGKKSLRFVITVYSPQFIEL